MANSTLLQLVTQATQEMGSTAPSSVIGNTTADVVQKLALLNAIGNELVRVFDWQALIQEYRFTSQYLTTTGTWTTAAATVTNIPTTAALAASTWMVTGTGIPTDTYIQSVDSPTQVTLTRTPTAAGTAAAISFAQTKYSLPSDYDRLIEDTEWDKTKRWTMRGPATSQQWQWLKSGFLATAPRIRFRVLGNLFQVWPMQVANEYLGFEYVSKYWAMVTGSSTISKSSFTLDTDTCVFPDRLMVTGLKLKYFKVKGWDTTATQSDYDDQLETAKGADKSAPKLSFIQRPVDLLISTGQLPDQGFGT